MGAFAEEMLRAAAVSSYAPHPVGALAATVANATATRIERDSQGRWEYGGEVPVEVTPVALREIALPSGEMLYWSGIEVRCLAKRLRGEEWIVAGLWPVSYLWNAEARLLGPLDPSRSGAAKQLADAWFPLNGDAKPEFDLFERDPGYRVARLDDPRRLHWQVQDGEMLGDGFLLGRSPNWSQNAVKGTSAEWRLGLCDDPGAIRDELVIGETARELLLKTEDDTIFDRYEWGRARTRVAVVDGGKHGKVLDRSVVGDERPKPVTAAARELAAEILRGAVFQALSGRGAGSGVRLEQAVAWAYIDLLKAFLERERSLVASEKQLRAVREKLLPFRRLKSGRRIQRPDLESR